MAIEKRSSSSLLPLLGFVALIVVALGIILLTRTTGPTDAQKTQTAVVSAPTNSLVATQVPATGVPANPVTKVAIPSSATPGTPGKTIKIGWAGDLSKQLVKPSQGILYGLQLAVAQRNKAGGVKGVQVEIIPLDDQCDGPKAAEVAKQFVNDPDIYAIVGHVCSGASIPASDIYQNAKIVMVSPSSTAFAVTARGLSVVNRVVFADDQQVLVLATYLYKEVGLRKLALFDDGQSYGRGLSVAMEREFKRLGGDIVNSTTLDKDRLDYRDALKRLLDVNPDGLFFGGYPGPAAVLAQQMKATGLKNTKLIGADGIYTSEFLQKSGVDADGAIASAVVQRIDEARVTAFKTEFESTFGVKYDDVSPYQPNAYDAAMVVLNALDKVTSVAADGKVTINRDNLIQAVRATKDFNGLTGILTCNAKGECGAGDVSINVVKTGKWEQLKIYRQGEIN